MANLEQLREDIKDLIAEEVPINCICPYCERDIDAMCLIDKDSKLDKEEWDGLANRVIAKVLNFVQSQYTIGADKVQKKGVR